MNSQRSRLRIVLADDSTVEMEVMKRIIDQNPNMKVVGCARNGIEAVKMVKQMKPDLAVFDVIMPGMNGIEATREVMSMNPLPIIIVSSFWGPTEVEITLDALDAGALDFEQKPVSELHPDYERISRHFLKMIRLLSEIKVVSRHRPKKGTLNNHIPVSRKVCCCVCIGASTGGPSALAKVLGDLDANLNCPVFVVQHIAAGFTEGFANWLRKQTGKNIIIPNHRTEFCPDIIYLANDSYHLTIKDSVYLELKSPQEGEAEGLVPSVAELFESAARVFGQKTIAVLLTGMGKDGAKEMKKLKDMGAYTIVQDEESSVVFGMPGEAYRIGAAQEKASLDRIGDLINQELKKCNLFLNRE